MEQSQFCKATDLAALFDISMQRIHQLVKEGVLQKHSPGKFDRDLCITTYCRYLRGVVKQQGSGSSNANLKQSRTDLLDMQKKNAELVYQQKTGKLLDIDDVQSLVNEGTAIFVGQKRSMGSRLAGKLAGMTDPSAILKLLNSENDKILQATSEKLYSLAGVGKPGRNRRTAAKPKSARVGKRKQNPAARKPRTRPVAQ